MPMLGYKSYYSPIRSTENFLGKIWKNTLKTSRYIVQKY